MKIIFVHKDCEQTPKTCVCAIVIVQCNAFNLMINLCKSQRKHNKSVEPLMSLELRIRVSFNLPFIPAFCEVNQKCLVHEYILPL